MHLVWPSSHEWFEVCTHLHLNLCAQIFVFVLYSSTSMGTICALKVARLWLTASRATLPLHGCVVNIFVLASSIVRPKQNLRCSCTFCNPTCQDFFPQPVVAIMQQQPPYPQCAFHWHGVTRSSLSVHFFLVLCDTDTLHFA